MNINDISPCIDHHARHNLLFVQGKIDGICHVDIGKELSRRIEDKLTLRQLPMICDDALNAMIDAATVNDGNVDSYVAIRNYGILFEPSLMINVHDRFEQWSRSRILIANLEGQIINDVFFLGKEQDYRFSIPLKDISYKTIDDNI